MVRLTVATKYSKFEQVFNNQAEAMTKLIELRNNGWEIKSYAVSPTGLVAATA